MLLVSIFLGVFFLIGLSLLGYGLLQAKRSMAAARWPTVPGKVVAIEMVEGSDGDSATTYRVRTTYSYSVRLAVANTRATGLPTATLVVAITIASLRFSID